MGRIWSLICLDMVAGVMLDPLWMSAIEGRKTVFTVHLFHMSARRALTAHLLQDRTGQAVSGSVIPVFTLATPSNAQSNQKDYHSL